MHSLSPCTTAMVQVVPHSSRRSPHTCMRSRSDSDSNNQAQAVAGQEPSLSRRCHPQQRWNKLMVNVLPHAYT